MTRWYPLILFPLLTICPFSPYLFVTGRQRVICYRTERVNTGKPCHGTIATYDTRTTLDAYHFYEDDWDSYEQLHEAFEWDVPDRFNMATYLCDRWADDKSRVALFAADAAGTEETYTFWQMRNVTNRLANYLRAQGVEEGDRVGVNAPQRPETVFAHLAAWKLGAMSVPSRRFLAPTLSSTDSTTAMPSRPSSTNPISGTSGRPVSRCQPSILR